jgi:hypothetical protein
MFLTCGSSLPGWAVAFFHFGGFHPAKIKAMPHMRQEPHFAAHRFPSAGGSVGSMEMTQ